MTTQTVLIKYVGNKPQKRDTVAGTQAVWFGKGDVQEVERAVAQRLLRHPDVWALASEEDNINLLRHLSPKETDDFTGKEVSKEKPKPTRVPEKLNTIVEESAKGLAEQQAKAEAEKQAKADAENAEDESEEVEPQDLETVLQSLHTDELNGKGKPPVALVRQRTGNPDLSVEEISEAWKALNG